MQLQWPSEPACWLDTTNRMKQRLIAAGDFVILFFVNALDLPMAFAYSLQW
jgi:hypothetical protein